MKKKYPRKLECGCIWYKQPRKRPHRKLCDKHFKEYSQQFSGFIAGVAVGAILANIVRKENNG